MAIERKALASDMSMWGKNKDIWRNHFPLISCRSRSSLLEEKFVSINSLFQKIEKKTGINALMNSDINTEKKKKNIPNFSNQNLGNKEQRLKNFEWKAANVCNSFVKYL